MAIGDAPVAFLDNAGVCADSLHCDQDGSKHDSGLPASLLGRGRGLGGLPQRLFARKGEVAVIGCTSHLHWRDLEGLKACSQILRLRSPW